MIYRIGNPGDSIILDNGSEPFTLLCPATFCRVLHAPSRTTFEFALRYRDIEVPKWVLTRLQVYKNWRESCKVGKMRGSIVSIECVEYGPTEIVRDRLTLSAMDALNIGTLCISTYPTRSDAWHSRWQQKVFSDTGRDGLAAQKIGLLAAYGLPGRNPEQNALVQNATDQHPQDVAAYTAQARKDHDS